MSFAKLYALVENFGHHMQPPQNVLMKQTREGSRAEQPPSRAEVKVQIMRILCIHCGHSLSIRSK